jgi:hypothetical protein
LTTIDNHFQTEISPIQAQSAVIIPTQKAAAMASKRQWLEEGFCEPKILNFDGYCQVSESIFMIFESLVSTV